MHVHVLTEFLGESFKPRLPYVAQLVHCSFELLKPLLAV